MLLDMAWPVGCVMALVQVGGEEPLERVANDHNLDEVVAVDGM
jgi:hypothetical protein